MPKAKDIVNLDTKVEQRDDMVIPDLGRPLEDDDRVDIAKPAGGYTPKQDQVYMGNLQFMEEPVTVIIHSSSERDGFNCTDYVSVNGIEAQILVKGRWVACPYLPKNEEFTTKRKFVDALLRAKSDRISTQVDRLENGQVSNRVSKHTACLYAVSLIEDKNPAGREWLKRRTASNF